MSTARFGKWADADEDEDEVAPAPGAGGAPMFETKADESGIKMIIDYKEKDGKTYKVTRRIKQTKITSWTNQKIVERKDLRKFGKAALNDAAAEKFLIVRSVEEILIVLSDKKATNVVVKDEAEDKFYQESITLAEGMATVKKTWTDMNKDKQEGRDAAAGAAAAEPEKPLEKIGGMGAMTIASKDGAGPRTYVPPSLRGKDGQEKGKGKGFDPVAQQEQSLRVTNISEDAKEGDLQDLFSSVGRLQRVYLAKDENGASRGFAFVTYYTREDALKAIAKLHGYGYDNLILQVQFAKPRV